MPKLVSFALVILALGLAVPAQADADCQCSYTLTQQSSTVVKATVQIGSCNPGIFVTSTLIAISVDGQLGPFAQTSGTSASTTASDPAGNQTFCAVGVGVGSKNGTFQFLECDPGQICATF